MGWQLLGRVVRLMVGQGLGMTVGLPGAGRVVIEMMKLDDEDVAVRVGRGGGQ